MRSELETGTDCYILTQSSSDHSSTSSSFWQGSSTVGHSLQAVLTLASCPQLTPTATGTQTDWSKPSVAPGYIIVSCPPTSCGCTHLPPSPNRSRWYYDIFNWMHLFRCSSAYLHRCISWLTARLRVNMLHPLYIFNLPTKLDIFHNFSAKKREINITLVRRLPINLIDLYKAVFTNFDGKTLLFPFF